MQVPKKCHTMTSGCTGVLASRHYLDAPNHSRSFSTVVFNARQEELLDRLISHQNVVSNNNEESKTNHFLARKVMVDSIFFIALIIGVIK